MAEKSRDAFRTISEVADWLDVPTHVLRFWESRFSQIKPVKRAGGRRYYRPSDMRIIGGVKVLLHDQGMTIRGVQKLFREEGLKHISAHSPALYDGDNSQIIEARALEPDELQEATRPASAARATRDAAIDPIPNDRPVAEIDDDTIRTESPVFRHTRDKRPETAAEESATAVPGGDAPDLAIVPDEDVQITTPAIPPTPDVPDTDPLDDDTDHAAGTGLAARLALKRPSELKAHRDTLEAAAVRLKALLERAF